MPAHPVLQYFQPRIAAWFAARFAAPTDAQVQAWPIIAAGGHALITAPTGSGKTLTAFLWALDRLITGHYAAGTTRVLYVSPLKALNTDIQRNLVTPLNELTAAFAAAGEALPHIRAQTRSGDTTAVQRAAMLRKPPEILITTPESLNLLLTGKSGRAALAGVQAVILDEIHDLVPSRRGVQLMTAVERLAAHAGEFQRIALSATVRPLDTVAAWVGGYRPVHHGGTVSYAPRPVTIVRSRDEKRIDFGVELPEAAAHAIASGEKIWVPIAAALRGTAARNRATLIFTNSRRLAESITLQINAGQEAPIAYAHHGSLSRDIRSAVEQRLKAGELQAIVATSSLEMGIDIGSLDEVVMLQSPPTIAATLQRIGRAGHQVGAVSRGTLIPSHGHDFLEAAALTEAVAARDIEPLQAVNGALDVLAQQLVSMTAHETWDIDALFTAVRCAAPYHDLPREHFDLVLEMLAGRYASTRIRALNTRVSLDRAANTVHARKGAVLALYTAGGSIPNRGYFALRHNDTNASIGELDEEFVWEATIGQVFALGTQQWRIKKITHDDVFVEPTQAVPGAPPFWRSEGIDRSHHFSLRIGDLLARFDATLATRGGAGRLHSTLTSDFAFNAAAATQLGEYLERQRDATQRALPHRHHLLIEHIAAGPDGYLGPDREQQIALHTMWGGRVNRPLALAMSAAWTARWGVAPKVHVDNDTIVFEAADDVDGASLLSLIDSGNIEQWLRPALESSSFFGARFRECAGRALLLAPRRFNHRQPLWMTRRAAKDLLAAVADKRDFPILLEAWRTCLIDEFDLGGLRARLDELADGTMSWDECATTSPSPFTGQLRFGQISALMYADDTAHLSGPSQLSDDLIRDSARIAAIRPQIGREIIVEYESRRLRLASGWAPAEASELIDWVRERVWLTATQWRELERAVRSTAGASPEDSALPEAGSLPGNDGDAVLQTAAAGLVWLVHDDGRRFVAATDVAIAIAALAANDDTAPRVDGQPPVLPLPGASQALTPRLTLHRLDSGALLDVQPLRRADLRDARELIAEALAYFGPRRVGELHAWAPFSMTVVDAALTALRTADRLVVGALVSGDPAVTCCDTASLEALLRIQRARRRASSAPLGIRHLPVFLANWQQFGGDVENALQRLRGYRAPAGWFEAELLPARVPGYAPHRLDEALRDGHSVWYGTAAAEIAFSDPAHLDLLLPARSGPEITFSDAHARYDFFTLAAAQSEPITAFAAALWRAAWGSRVTTDDFAAVRAGLAADFTLPEIPVAPLAVAFGAHLPALERAQRNVARQRARGWPGTWRRLSADLPATVSTAPGADEPAPRTGDAVDDLERSKALVRVLLARYGVLCRDLVGRESPPFVWRTLFRALRVMELGGEVTAGHFFADLCAPQFADPAALRLLERAAVAVSPPALFWCSAVDPISPCGLVDGTGATRALAAVGPAVTASSTAPSAAAQTHGPGATWPVALPRRAPGNHLAFRGSELIFVSEARGRRLHFTLPPDDPDIAACVAPLTHLLNRSSQRSERIEVDTINGAPATASPYLPALRGLFDVLVDHRQVTLRRRFS